MLHFSSLKATTYAVTKSIKAIICPTHIYKPKNLPFPIRLLRLTPIVPPVVPIVSIPALVRSIIISPVILLLLLMLRRWRIIRLWPVIIIPEVSWRWYALTLAIGIIVPLIRLLIRLVVLRRRCCDDWKWSAVVWPAVTVFSPVVIAVLDVWWRDVALWEVLREGIGSRVGGVIDTAASAVVAVIVVIAVTVAEGCAAEGTA